jgi:hypothetical protein
MRDDEALRPSGWRPALNGDRLAATIMIEL